MSLRGHLAKGDAEWQRKRLSRGRRRRGRLRAEEAALGCKRPASGEGEAGGRGDRRRGGRRRAGRSENAWEAGVWAGRPGAGDGGTMWAGRPSAGGGGPVWAGKPERGPRREGAGGGGGWSPRVQEEGGVNKGTCQTYLQRGVAARHLFCFTLTTAPMAARQAGELPH